MSAWFVPPIVVPAFLGAIIIAYALFRAYA
jgi:hypothetical protein